MADSYPYMISNNKISVILEKIRGAAKPQRFTHEFLKQLGFGSSNDRAVIGVLKRLGFLTDDGAPTEYYARLKDVTDWQYVLGERIKDHYKDIFAVDTTIYKSTDSEIKGAISRVTGKDETSVNRYATTFKTLAGLAKFDSSPKLKESASTSPDVRNEAPVRPKNDAPVTFLHNIQIQLPATTDVAVYNAIFKSVRDNLIN